MLAKLTGRCQSLDRRIHEAIKERARAGIEGCVALQGDDAMAIHESVVVLLEVQRQATREEAGGIIFAALTGWLIT
jgi:hypothetical protein